MPVTIDDVRHIAALARLGVSDERGQALVGELNTILAHMDVLQAVDTSAVASDEEERAMPLRPDAGPPVPLAHPLDAMAPALRDGFFLVPRVATHENAESSA
jgi:aspartyl-tRNA(Asn)/glutamyl-tRNA(Gln) amidotransferase subunit C